MNPTHTTVRNAPDANRVRRTCARIATALLPAPVPATVGDIALHTHQRDAAARILAILTRHGVALLADDVGLGKTYAALAVAEHYAHVGIIAPATLLPMWRSAIAATGATPRALISLHRFSHHAIDIPPASSGRRLVIIDEAHHLRARGTRRYHAIAQHVAGAHVLLVSATPLHNRRTDPSALFALAMGEHAPLTTAALAPLIVRHTHHDTIGAANAPPTLHRPAVRHHPPARLIMHRQVLDAILALPAPLAAHDGAAAGALIRLGLLRAWCSSDAALASAVRRRRLRGAAVEDALRAGRHPTTKELRTWIVGEFEGQLAFPELLTEHATDGAPRIELLTRHLDALGELAQLHERLHTHGHDTDSQRAAWLRALKADNPDTPILAFSQFTRTVDALQRALRDIAGIAALTGTHARIASGVIPRHDALARFAPRAQERPPPPPHQAITLLLATDLLAEGVNLQDAGIVVHLDLPWTAARRDQRVGRCVRVGSRHREVQVHRLAPPADIERAVTVARHVARKALLAHRLLGDGPHTHAHQSPARVHPLTARTRLLGLIAHWQRGDWVSTRTPSRTTHPARSHPPTCAALAVLTDGATTRVLALDGPLWRVRQSDVALAGAVECIDLAVRHRAFDTLFMKLTAPARYAVQRWVRRERARTAMSTGAEHPAHSALRRRLFARIGAASAQLSTTQRYQYTNDIYAARRCVSVAYGAAAHDALAEWERAAHQRSAESDPIAWLTAWQANPILVASTRTTERTSHERQAAERATWRVRAAIVWLPEPLSCAHPTR